MIYAVNINQQPLMYFFAGGVVSVWIFYVNQIMNKKSREKMDDILNRVKRIEERIDGLYKK